MTSVPPDPQVGRDVAGQVREALALARYLVVYTPESAEAAAVFSRAAARLLPRGDHRGRYVVTPMGVSYYGPEGEGRFYPELPPGVPRDAVVTIEGELFRATPVQDRLRELRDDLRGVTCPEGCPPADEVAELISNALEAAEPDRYERPFAVLQAALRRAGAGSERPVPARIAQTILTDVAGAVALRRARLGADAVLAATFNLLSDLHTALGDTPFVSEVEPAGLGCSTFVAGLLSRLHVDARSAVERTVRTAQVIGAEATLWRVADGYAATAEESIEAALDSAEDWQWNERLMHAAVFAYGSHLLSRAVMRGARGTASPDPWQRNALVAEERFVRIAEAFRKRSRDAYGASFQALRERIRRVGRESGGSAARRAAREAVNLEYLYPRRYIAILTEP